MKVLFQKLLPLTLYIFILGMVIVTVLMLIELPPKQEGWAYWDKVQHLAVFFVLTLFGCLAFMHKIRSICLGLAAYGALMEVCQSLFTVTRMASVYDWLADVAGIILCATIVYLVKQRMLKYANPS